MMLHKAKLFVATLALACSFQALVPSVVSADCGGTKTRIINCSDSSGEQAIGSLIKIGILVMSILIGVVATGGIAYAAVLYASARDSEGQIEQSKTIIRNIMIGLLLYGFMIAIMNWLIPGGVIEIG